MKQIYKKKKQKASVPTNVYYIKDEIGNTIISTHHGNFATICLKLNSENFQRQLGVVHFDKREFYVKRKREKHLMVRANSYGFNHYILDNALLFDNVVVEDEYHKWRIPRAIILEQGKFMHFKNNGGFELQLFVSLDTLSNYEVGKSI
jgi:hypothetical protein